MDFVATFLRRYEASGARLAAASDLPDDLWRARPHGLNSVAWLVWHLRRAEDVGLSRLVFDRQQLFDEGTWPARLNVPLRHHGGGMTSPEVDELSARIDLDALRAYSAAVATRTAELVRTADLEALDRVVERPVLLRLFEEGALRPPHSDWPRDRPPYTGMTGGEVLIHFALMHNHGHFHDVSVVRGLLVG